MGVGEFEMAYLLGEGCRGEHAQRAEARARKADTGDLEELTTVEVHRALLIRWKPGIFAGFFWTITVAAAWLPTSETLANGRTDCLKTDHRAVPHASPHT
jgi:hypothetical protein